MSNFNWQNVEVIDGQ